jgi:hypothetical protein
MPTLLIHITNEEPVMGEVDELPAATDLLVVLKNPRKRDGKDLPYLEQNVTQVIWPMNRINYIEIIPGAEEEDIVSFVRE